MTAVVLVRSNSGDRGSTSEESEMAASGISSRTHAASCCSWIGLANELNLQPGLHVGRLCVINVAAYNRHGAMEDELVILDGGMGDELRQKAPDQPW